MDRSSGMQIERHVAFLEMMLESLPPEYEWQEVNRLTLAYFAVSGLSVLGALQRVDKDRIISWVLSLQIRPRDRSELDDEFFGFHGSRSFQFPRDDAKDLVPNGSHLASTYRVLAILKIVGYDLSALDPESILFSMRNLQKPDGSFMSARLGGETDLRFVYCASAICYILNSWIGMDKERAKEYISVSDAGGGTYCAIAALRLMGFIKADIVSQSAKSTTIDVPLLLEWSLRRQAVDGGFQGRANKLSDTCYAFWGGGVLKILGPYHFLDIDALHRFLFSCQSQYGGFAKFPGNILPELYHSYYSFAASVTLCRTRHSGFEHYWNLSDLSLVHLVFSSTLQWPG